MRFAPVFRRRFVVAVESQTLERTAVQLPADPDAQAGARWGRPTAFDIASRARAPDTPAGFSATWIDNARVFKGTESHRAYNHALASVSGEQLEPEGIRSVTFDCGIRKERRDVGGVIFTNLIRDYVKLDLPLGVEGSRGQPHPPPTPEEDLDETYG